MIWDTAKKYGTKLYEWYGNNEAAMDEVDRKAKELFSQDMTPARQLPIMSTYWMIVDGQYWYVTHDDITLGIIASTYLPVDRNVENVWNKRRRELWVMQPEEFKFMAINFGTQYNPNKITKLSNGELAYWGPIPNGTPVLMPQESVDILYQYKPGAEVANFDPLPSDLIKIGPEIVSSELNPNIVNQMQLSEVFNLGTSNQKSTKHHYWVWGLGSVAVLSAIGTGIYFWKFRK